MPTGLSLASSSSLDSGLGVDARPLLEPRPDKNVAYTAFSTMEDLGLHLDSDGIALDFHLLERLGELLKALDVHTTTIESQVGLTEEECSCMEQLSSHYIFIQDTLGLFSLMPISFSTALNPNKKGIFTRKNTRDSIQKKSRAAEQDEQAASAHFIDRWLKSKGASSRAAILQKLMSEKRRAGQRDSMHMVAVQETPDEESQPM